MDITNEIDNALYETKQLSKLLTVLVRSPPVKLNFFFSTLSLYLRWIGKQHWGEIFLVLVFKILLQKLMWVTLWSCWCVLTIATTYLEKFGSFLSQKYRLMSMLRQGWWEMASNLDIRSTFRIEILNFDWPLRWMVAMRNTGIKDREFRGLARDSSCCKKNFVLEYYSRYVSHMTRSCILRIEIF